MIASLLIVGAILLIAYVVYRVTAKPRNGEAPSLGLLAYKEEAAQPSAKGDRREGGPRA